ncbi:MAG: bifunctional 4-hydroxy-2-oxoglutarate aldolase/2-dehydro-3-deoxy-phosphogluconate aldolase [Lachnospiraceae bacterium]
MNLLDKISNGKIIAIVRGIPTTHILETAHALLAGGIYMMEVTFNQSSHEGIRETADSIRLLNEKLRGKILLGAGTVLTSEQVQLARDCGAEYIISPNVDVDVIKKTKELGMISIPGAFTPSETVAAWHAGADIVKLFPAGLLGSSYIKSVRGPLAHIPVSAVGGIDEHNIAGFFKAGVCSVGIGGNLVNREAILAGDYQVVTETARNLVAALETI